MQGSMCLNILSATFGNYYISLTQSCYLFGIITHNILSEQERKISIYVTTASFVTICSKILYSLLSNKISNSGVMEVF